MSVVAGRLPAQRTALQAGPQETRLQGEGNRFRDKAAQSGKAGRQSAGPTHVSDVLCNP